jgi:magnesium and cobalt transporter
MINGNGRRMPTPPWRRLLRRLRWMHAGQPVDRGQVIELLAEGRAAGLLDQEAFETMQRVLAVSDLRVRDVMVPRVQMVVVDRAQSPEEMLPTIIESAHSRFPVIDGDRDRVAGILLAKDLLRYFHDPRLRAQFNPRDVLRPAVFIPESKRLNVLLAEFRASRNHMAIVMDEYGGVAGLVTIEDVLEQIVGEIHDEYDFDAELDMIRERSDGWVVKGILAVEDFNERFGTAFDIEASDTVAGLVTSRLGYVPARGEIAEIGAFRFEVLHADTRRVHLLKVTRREATGAVAAG